MEEIWKNCKGFYEVSNIGNVRNSKTGRILNTQKDTIGYLRVPLYIDKIPKGFLVHRLVSEAFIPNPENKPEVNHKDGNKSNNNYLNLEWNTTSENHQHAYDTGLRKKKKGVDNIQCKTTNESVLEIRKKWLTGMYQQKELAIQYNLSRGAVYSIIHRITWNHI